MMCASLTCSGASWVSSQIWKSFSTCVVRCLRRTRAPAKECFAFPEDISETFCVLRKGCEMSGADVASQRRIVCLQRTTSELRISQVSSHLGLSSSFSLHMIETKKKRQLCTHYILKSRQRLSRTSTQQIRIKEFYDSAFPFRLLSFYG